MEQENYEGRAYNDITDDERNVVQSLTKISNLYQKVNGNIDTADFSNLVKILPAILELQLQKSSVYGRSYCRHGELSIFFNTERKWDRLLNIMEKAMKNNSISDLHSEGTATETFFDTLVDLASYSLLWIGYIVEQDPSTLEKFIKANKLSD